MKPTVLLPGTLCDGRVFGSLPDRLAAPVILDHSAFADARHAATALLDSVAPGSLGIAFSLGSWVLLEMLRLDPARFGAILLVSGNSHPDARENAATRRERVAMARVLGFETLFAPDWPAMLGPARRDEAKIRALIVAMAERAGHDCHARQAEMNLGRPDHRGLVLAPPLPIHVIAGAEDGLCPPARYEAAAAGPGSSLTVLDGVGHYLPIEAPEALAAFVKTRFPEYCT